ARLRPGAPPAPSPSAQGRKASRSSWSTMPSSRCSAPRRRGAPASRCRWSESPGATARPRPRK
ncbi:MAG: hypothetical protein ACK55I_04125, partial [bacterium]